MCHAEVFQVAASRRGEAVLPLDGPTSERGDDRLQAVPLDDVQTKDCRPSAAKAVTPAGSLGGQRTVSHPGAALRSAFLIPCRRVTSTVETAGPHRKTAKENSRLASNVELP